MLGPGMSPWERAELERLDREAEDRANERSCQKHDALVDIAYDCATLESAQKRAHEALKK